MLTSDIIGLISRSEGLRLLRKLGKGAFGELYLVEDNQTKKQYGLKLLPPEISMKMPLGALVDSVRDAANFEHPNAASTFKFGFVGGQAYVLREYVPGNSLSEHAAYKSTPLRGVFEVARQSVAALAAAHNQSVVHRDIKPNNIIITPGQEVKIVDFGMGKFKRRVEADMGLFRRGAFEAPEQEPGEAEPKSDIFSLGAVLRHTAFKRPADFYERGRSNFYSILAKHRSEKHNLPEEMQVSRWQAVRLADLMDVLVEPDPKNRPSANEVMSELLEIGVNPSERSLVHEARPPRPPRPPKYRPPDAAADKGVRSARQVNAWLVGTESPLRLGREYKIGVNIGTARAGRIGGGSFNEPDWGKQQELTLLISLTGTGAEVRPGWVRAVLPRTGNMRAKHFKIIPRMEGLITLHLSIFLDRELTLLEEFRIEIVAVEEKVEVAA